jgi:hypothetical protein
MKSKWPFMDWLFESIWWVIPLVSFSIFVLWSWLRRGRSKEEIFLYAFGFSPLVILISYVFALLFEAQFHGVWDLLRRGLIIMLFWVGPFYVLSAVYALSVIFSERLGASLYRRPLVVLASLLGIHLMGTPWSYVATHIR